MSGLGDIHPSDRALLERLAFMLMDVARGDLVTRGPLVPLTEALMSRQRDGDDCSADEVGAVVDQLLAIADDWYGVRALAEAATAVITGAPLPALGYGPTATGGFLKRSWRNELPRRL